MKKLLLFVILSVSCLAETYSFGYSLNTYHINEQNKDYELCENNNVFTLERREKSKIIGFSVFKNSFYNDSQMIYIGQIKDKNNKGFFSSYKVSLCKGYNKTEYLKSKTEKNLYWVFENKYVLYKDYSIIPMISVGYSFDKYTSVECVLSGNALITNIKYTF